MRKFFSLITALVLCTAMWGGEPKVSQTLYKVEGALYQGLNEKFTGGQNIFVPNDSAVVFTSFDGQPADWYRNNELQEGGEGTPSFKFQKSFNDYAPIQIRNYTGYGQNATKTKIDYIYGKAAYNGKTLVVGASGMNMMSMANGYYFRTEDSASTGDIGKCYADNKTVNTYKSNSSYGTYMMYGNDFTHSTHGAVQAYEMVLDNPGEMYIDYVVLPIFGYPKDETATIEKMIPEGKKVTLKLYPLSAISKNADGKYSYTKESTPIATMTADASAYTQDATKGFSYRGTLKFELDEPILMTKSFVARLTWDDGCNFGLITDYYNLQNYTTWYIFKDGKYYLWTGGGYNSSISYHATFPTLDKKDTKTAFNFASTGGSDNIAFRSNIDPAKTEDFTIDFGGAEWISMTGITYSEGTYKKSGTNTLTFAVEANEGEAREATITLKHHGKVLTYTVSQEAAPAPVEPTNLYLKAGDVNYMTDGAVVYLYSWGGSSEADWSKFELIQNETTAKALMMKDRTGMKIVRFASGTTTPSWEGTIWNQTGDITVSGDFPEKVDMVELPAWADATSATWSKYTKPAVITYKDSVYYVAGNFTKWAAEMKKLPAEVELPADSTIEFKQVLTRTVLADGDSVRQDTIWYGQPNKGNFMTRDNSTWKLDGAENVLATTDIAGKYTFSINEKGEFVLGWPELPAEGLPKITEAPKSWAGEYVITAMKDENTALVWTGVDAGQCRVEAPVADNKLTNNDFVKVIVEALQEGGYSIKVKGGTNDGKYITQKAKPDYNNALSFVTTPVRVDIEMNENGLVDIYQTVSATQKVYLLYNAQSGTSNERFRFYKDTNHGGANYKSLTLFGTVAPEPPVRKAFVFVAGAAAEADPALFAITWGKDGSNETVKLANKEADIYTAEILETVDSVVLVRCATGATEIIWDGEGKNVWNQTANYALCDTMYFGEWVDGSNRFTITCEAPKPVEVKYYLKNNWNGAAEWSWKEMTKKEEAYVLDSVIFGGMGVNLNTKEDDADAVWFDLNKLTYNEKDTIQALDTVRFELTISEKDTVLKAIIIGRPAPAPRKEFVFVAGEVAESNPTLFAITWGKDGSNETVKLANKEADIYTAEILETVDSLVLVRCASDAAEIIWDGEGKNVWNQTDNYAICDTMYFGAWVDGSNRFTITCEAPKPVEVKYYITGNAALVGEDKAWNAQAIEMTDSAYVFTELAAGEYEMKITNGAWDPEGQSWGSAALSEECSAGVGDKSGNIYFVVETANDVTVSIANGKVTVIGTFKQVATGITVNVTVPEGTPACFFYGEMSGNTFVEMTKVDDTHYTKEFPKATSIGWGYKFVWENGNWSTCNADPEGDIKVEPVEGVINVEVKAWVTNPGVEYKYTTYTEWQVKYGPTWEWVNMTKQEAGYFTVEAVWGNTGINIASGENPIKQDWYPLGNPALTIGEDVVEGCNVVISLTVVDDETVALNVSKSEGPQPEKKYYVTGNAALVGEDKAWDPAAIEMVEGKHIFEALPKGEYKLKVTDGTWDHSWGYSELSKTVATEGLTTDEDNNVCFTIYTPNDVTITIIEGHILAISGDFVNPQPADEGFGIIFSDGKTIKGTKNEKQTEFLEYKIVADLTAGTTFQLYDFANKAAWTETNIDEASTSFLRINDDNVYEVTADGKYTIYLKMYGLGNNQVYCAYDGSATNLNNLKALDGKRYNILGQPVNETYHGIVIMNGQTYLQ